MGVLLPKVLHRLVDLLYPSRSPVNPQSWSLLLGEGIPTVIRRVESKGKTREVGSRVWTKTGSTMNPSTLGGNPGKTMYPPSFLRLVKDVYGAQEATRLLGTRFADEKESR